jgi:hypothetical protein
VSIGATTGVPVRNSQAVLWAVLLALSPSAARADDASTAARLEALERRVEGLERERDDLRTALEDRDAQLEAQQDSTFDWTQRVRLSGSANTGFYQGGPASQFAFTNFQVWDARFFIDADLGRDVRLGEIPIARNLGFSFEWDLVRIGDLQNDVGELYTDVQGIGGQDWLSAQVGRFYIPVGENYLLYGKGYRNNPFISNTIGGPWWWDEGVRIYGSFLGDQLGYAASVADGETPFDTDARKDPQLTLKLYARPLPWLYLSASGLYSGQIGSPTEPAMGALWLGETWATGVGSLSPLPTFQNGVVAPPGPTQLNSTNLVAADLILTPENLGRLWLAYGRYEINVRGGPSSYDRELTYWIVQYVLGGGVISPELASLYLALGANALGTYDSNKGYLLDVRQAGRLGYNMESQTAFSVALGWHMTPWATFRAEYTRQLIDLVRNVPVELRDAASGSDYFGVELGVAF